MTNSTEFVESLRRSGLLEPARVEETCQVLVKKFAEPRKLAGELIRLEWLTPYQVNQMFQGKAKELSLGPYLLLERLGEGGMGQVFKARHRNLQRIVALKILRPDLLDNEIAVRRFLRESRAAAQLTHQNIVRGFDADQVNGRYYLAMEYIQGIDLAHMVKQQGPLKVAQACDYARQVACGLQHAFERGMVHRDIKPGNLLVTQPTDLKPGNGIPQNSRLGNWGMIKILDMGLARLTRPEDKAGSTELTHHGTMMGTPDFIAPEQARDAHGSDIRSDLYSLGCTLYFLLTGKPPFPTGTVNERLLKHQLEEPEKVEDVRRREMIKRGANPGELKYLSSRVGNLVRRLMAKNPDDRFQTPAQVVEALNQLLVPSSSAAVKRPVLPHPATFVTKKTPAKPIRRVRPVLLPQKISAPADAPTLLEIGLAPVPAADPGLLQSGPGIPAAPPKPRKTWTRRAGRVLVISGVFLACLALSKSLWSFQSSSASQTSTKITEKNQAKK